jgi:peptide/nickel transport system permease protein
VSGAILFESTLSLLGLGPSNATSLGTMLYWAIAWGSVRTGAWWAFVPPTLMLTLIVFGLLLLQSSLNEVFNPRLRRGRAAKKRDKTGAGPESPAGAGGTEPVGAVGFLETPLSAGTEQR